MFNNDVEDHDGGMFQIARLKEYRSPLPQTGPSSVTVSKPAYLDSAPMVDLHRRLLNHYTNELDRQYENRKEMAVDADFYDNLQWDEADAQVLRDRGQEPLVYNVISASLDWVTGTEKRTRRDFKVLPRRKEQSKPAERKSQLLKYLSDVNKTPFHVSRAFTDAVKVGVGWIEDGIQEETEDEALYTRYETWRNVLWDSACTERDLSDARYLFRSKWVDLDVAIAMFPNRRELLTQSVADSQDFIQLDEAGDEAMDSNELTLQQPGQTRSSDRINGYQRQRVRLIEAWIREPVTTKVISGGDFRGEIYDEYSPGHHDQVQSGEAEVIERMRRRMHVCIFTGSGMLHCSPSPYRHNRFPMTPIWGNVRDKDGMPYGIIRRLRDIQRDVNKRASKALHILSTNKTVMEEGAVDDLDEFREEVARPDAVLVVKQGKKLDLNVDRELTQWHLELMSRSISMIQQASGVTDELMGRGTNAKSGVAIRNRQEQGSLATASYFDNLLFASQVRGENSLANVEQFMSEEKQFRITDQRQNAQFYDINDGLPENDIVRSKADFILSDEDFHATLRQAAVDALLEVMAKLPPETGLLFLDLVVENMDLPNREELVRRIRGATGQRDPDQEEPTPEELAKEQAATEAQALEKATIEAQLKKLIADADKSSAQAKQIMAQLAKTNVDTTAAALTAAQQVIAVPVTADVADHILHEAGFVSRSDGEEALQAVAAQAAQQQPTGIMRRPPPQRPAMSPAQAV